jgi:hypothetical protein
VLLAIRPRKLEFVTCINAPLLRFLFGQSHSSLADGNAAQSGTDDVLMPTPPLDPDAPLDP